MASDANTLPTKSFRKLSFKKSSVTDVYTPGFLGYYIRPSPHPPPPRSFRRSNKGEKKDVNPIMHRSKYQRVWQICHSPQKSRIKSTTVDENIPDSTPSLYVRAEYFIALN